MSELSQWEPKRPKLKVIGDYLRRVREASMVGDFAVGQLPELSEALAYGDRLTTGKGETRNLKGFTAGVLDLPIPGPGAVKAGAKGLGVLMSHLAGPIGIRQMGKAQVEADYRHTMSKLLRSDPKDWQGQSRIIEEAGGTPVPRGRDADPTLPTVKFGREIEGGRVSPELLRVAREQDSMDEGTLRYYNTLERSYNNPKLYGAYPDLKNYGVEVVKHSRPDQGSFSPSKKSITLSHTTRADETERILAHEIQHAIGEIENWPRGSNQRHAREQLFKLRDVEEILKDSRYMSAMPDFPDEAMRQIKKQADLLRKFKEGKNFGEPSASWQMYRREAGEQLAEAAAQSQVYGGKISSRYTVDPYQMYDERVLRKALP